MKKDIVYKIISVLLLVGWMTVIFCFSAQVGEESEDTSGVVTRLILSVFVPDFDSLSPEIQQQYIENIHSAVRTLGHFTEFLILGILAANAARIFKLGLWRVYGAAVSVLYCISDEVHQLFVPGRAFQLTDIAVDTAGILCGIGLLSLALFILNRIKQKRTI